MDCPNCGAKNCETLLDRDVQTVKKLSGEGTFLAPKVTKYWVCKKCHKSGKYA